MVDNPNTNYYKPSIGSLAGFDSVIIPQEGDISKTGWSLDELRAFLLNENHLNFPTEDWVRMVDETLDSHISDFNNPHRVTLDQIIQDFVADIIGNITPGTPPDIAPFYAYDATCALPLGDIFPATYSTTNLYRMSDSGAFVDPLTELEFLGVDCGIDTPAIPLFSSIINKLRSDWSSVPESLNHVTLQPVAHPTINYPFTFYQVAEVAGLASGFGLYLPMVESTLSAYNVTFFILPSTVLGSLKILSPVNYDDFMIVDLTTGDFTCATPNVQCKTYIYANGMIKVSFSCVTQSNGITNAIQIYHLDTESTTTSRVGQNGRVIFTIANPVITSSPLNQPVAINPYTAASTTPFVLDFSKVTTATSLGSFIVTLSLDLYPLLPTAPLIDTQVLNFGSLTITRDRLNLYVKSQGITVFTSSIIPGSNIISLSYSPTKIICKDIPTPRVVTLGTYPSVSTNSISLGPCGGYLKYISFYAHEDKTACLEYLTNG